VVAIKSTLFQFWQQKELELGRTISISEAAKATGLHRDTIKRLMDGSTSRFDEPVISGLCAFFAVPPGPIPFLIYEPSPSNEPDTPLVRPTD
jgi:hypothetical protein